ncbi:MAG: hypothetical protein CV087_08280 [Candidatus Brocadia sp. WS118]|nr:MAG: hypothetical protein CV087_08280 [Candidatus Brocadia sp. WS118]
MTGFNYIENFESKSLKDFKPGDTLYIHKTIQGYTATYLCAFERIARGVVYGRVLDYKPTYMKTEIGSSVKARAKFCSLYGKDPGDWHARFHFFKNTTDITE